MHIPIPDELTSCTICGAQMKATDYRIYKCSGCGHIHDDNGVCLYCRGPGPLTSLDVGTRGPELVLCCIDPTCRARTYRRLKAIGGF